MCRACTLHSAISHPSTHHSTLSPLSPGPQPNHLVAINLIAPCIPAVPVPKLPMIRPEQRIDVARLQASGCCPTKVGVALEQATPYPTMPPSSSHISSPPRCLSGAQYQVFQPNRHFNIVRFVNNPQPPPLIISGCSAASVGFRGQWDPASLATSRPCSFMQVMIRLLGLSEAAGLMRRHHKSLQVVSDPIRGFSELQRHKPDRQCTRPCNPYPSLFNCWHLQDLELMTGIMQLPASPVIPRDYDSGSTQPRRQMRSNWATHAPGGGKV
ncbi:uncharacterized protein BDV17DRAFT_149171 [Aspergillus undulatus]|uniref:uncharacterized protein n=1 Tax=Aspergillus undulatus TaxID=1810928 RepID=UPI003CCD168F